VKRRQHNLAYRNDGAGIAASGLLTGSTNAFVESNTAALNGGGGVEIGAPEKESPAAYVYNNTTSL
jgi:hypothetical protein